MKIYTILYKIIGVVKHSETIEFSIEFNKFPSRKLIYKTIENHLQIKNIKYKLIDVSRSDEISIDHLSYDNVLNIK